MMHAHRLLQSYVQEGSQETFQEIVVGHLGLVYGVALRCLNGDAALADDACQIVFQSLAQKARSLPPDTIMTGWLYRHTFHTASRMARAEKRRHLREKRAAADLETTGNEGPDSTHEAEQVAAKLLAGLPTQDRAALLLRFYEDRSFREIGKMLGVSEDAAQKRVARAIEKLRSKLRKVGTGIAASALTAYLTSIGATQVPATLASRILASAAGGAATTGGFTALATIATTLQPHCNYIATNFWRLEFRCIDKLSNDLNLRKLMLDVGTPTVEFPRFNFERPGQKRRNWVFRKIHQLNS